MGSSVRIDTAKALIVFERGQAKSVNDFYHQNMKSLALFFSFVRPTLKVTLHCHGNLYSLKKMGSTPPSTALRPAKTQHD